MKIYTESTLKLHDDPDRIFNDPYDAEGLINEAMLLHYVASWQPLLNVTQRSKLLLEIAFTMSLLNPDINVLWFA